ncbi:hypothetical protein [Campylobacter sp. RM16187]|uniref:hypothetical protein n=1 Tax=Campylobacter sp. RM16187 TaxID=1660063 RepID=UPI0021B65247|nr:hypothetical protein [Campylobacter sp. RM16187]QKG29495.1 hypothetical protein CDOMF_1241 [Campylobacter sp. RM16187]
MQDKEDLLALHEESQKVEQNLDFNTLLIVYIIMLIAFTIFLPKIYITNQIYYTSREIADLSGKRDVLLEENKDLRLRVEQIKYKHQISDQLNLK